MFLIFPAFCSYLVLLVSSYLVRLLRISLHKEIRKNSPSRMAPGRWSLQSFFDCSNFQGKNTIYTGFTDDNKAITETITFGIKSDPCETLPTFADLCFVLDIPNMSHCSSVDSMPFLPAERKVCYPCHGIIPTLQYEIFLKRHI